MGAGTISSIWADDVGASVGRAGVGLGVGGYGVGATETVGASVTSGSQSSPLPPFDFPLLPHEGVLALLVVHTDGDVGPGRR